MNWSGDRATLTLTHLNKEDEGLYTLRVTTKSGYETYSAYVFVRGMIMTITMIPHQNALSITLACQGKGRSHNTVSSDKITSEYLNVSEWI